MDPAAILDFIRATPPGGDVRAADDLVLFRVDKARFRYGQSYALLRGDRMVLVDAVHAATRAAVDRWRGTHAPALLVLTHSDLVGQAFGPLGELSDWLGAPVLVHSADRPGGAGRPIEEAGDLLDAHGLSYAHVPGHTPGSVALYARPERYLFAGDAAVGPRYDDDAGGFTHPPIADADWPAFRAGWAAVDGPVSAVLPLHGRPALDVGGPSAASGQGFDALRRDLLTPGNVMRA